MHTDIKETFVARLTEIRNYVVADVQLTNGREIEFKSATEKVEKEQDQSGGEGGEEEKEEEESKELEQEKSLGSRMINLLSLNPDKKDLYRLICSLISLCTLWILYHLWKKGIIGKFSIKIVQTRLFRLLMKIIFNYKY